MRPDQPTILSQANNPTRLDPQQIREDLRPIPTTVQQPDSPTASRLSERPEPLPEQGVFTAETGLILRIGPQHQG